MAEHTLSTRDKLKAIASNLWWSWHPEAIQLFESINPAAYHESGNNPVAVARMATPAIEVTPDFASRVDAVYDQLQAYLGGERRYRDAPSVAYFCMEYGLHESLPFYAGGLGILAGDHTKASSDLGMPFTAIGLLLREGYFIQKFDESGWQRSSYPAFNPVNHPLTLVRREDGSPLTVTVHVGETPLRLQAWRLDIGRTALYLLDSDFDRNPEELRNVTRELYQGGDAVRIQQEIVLGIGGVRLLRSLGLQPDVYHMNEGHCAFLTFELLRERLGAGDTLQEAEEWARQRCVFTTHTPVPAGHDRFEPGLFNSMMSRLRRTMELSERDLLAYGRVNPDDPAEWFTMTVLGLKLSRRTNGVSALHGEVSRRMWHGLYPDRSIEDVPITHVTNGVHLPTWTAQAARTFLERNLGDWMANQNNPEFWQRINEVSDEDLWAYRNSLRRRLVDFINDRLPRQSLLLSAELNPDALTIGFARRFAPYKRAMLLFQNEEEAIKLFSDVDRPVQIVFSGKAHPMHYDGKLLIQQIYRLAQHPALRGKLILLENYNMEIARYLVSGTDVWLNNPRRPLEASGTSGQKITLHGGLNVSILDGWWPEGYNGQNGWAIGYEASADIKDPAVQDSEDADFLLKTLRDQVVPTFYERDEHGRPAAWLQRVRSAITTLSHAFSAERMLVDYVDRIYRRTPEKTPPTPGNGAVRSTSQYSVFDIKNS